MVHEEWYLLNCLRIKNIHLKQQIREIALTTLFQMTLAFLKYSTKERIKVNLSMQDKALLLLSVKRGKLQQQILMELNKLGKTVVLIIQT